MLGQAHALTFSCYRNRPFLARERTCDWLVEATDSARRQLAFELWAYVFMPDHVHLVVYPKRENHSISRILLATGQQARPYRFWQKGGGYDRNITQVATLVETMRV